MGIPVVTSWRINQSTYPLSCLATLAPEVREWLLSLLGSVINISSCMRSRLVVHAASDGRAFSAGYQRFQSARLARRTLETRLSERCPETYILRYQSTRS